MKNVQEQSVTFDKYVHEANRFINKLANDLGHPDEEKRVYILLKSVIHTVRDRISISESFDFMSQMPTMLRGIYVEQWKYSEKPPLSYQTIEEMKDEVKARQQQLGEQEFEWSKSTEELISIVINCFKQLTSEGQLKHIKDQMPKEVKELF